MKHLLNGLFVAAALLAAATGPELHAQFGNDGSGIKASAAIDLLGKAGSAGVGRENRFEVREVEFLIYAPVDHLFYGRFNMAAHPEPNGAFFEIHEAFVGSTRLVPGLEFRLGYYFLSIGRLNQIHRHDWDFVSAPRYHVEFFDEEAVIDSGLEVSYLMPTSFYWNLLVGVTSGWTFGHSHNLGTQPDIPTHYLRSEHYFDLPKQGGLKFGLNYLGRKNDSATRFHFGGLDVTAKWRRNKRVLFQLLSETWMRLTQPSGQAQETTVGGYLYPQFGLSDVVSVGTRLDYFTILSLKDALGNRVTNGTFAAVPTLTIKPSEFATIRTAYTLEYQKDPGATGQFAHGFEFQFMFILGAHPPHGF